MQLAVSLLLSGHGKLGWGTGPFLRSETTVLRRDKYIVVYQYPTGMNTLSIFLMNLLAVLFNLTDKITAFLAVLVYPVVGARAVHQGAVLSVVEVVRLA